jgi:hypothetical protein
MFAHSILFISRISHHLLHFSVHLTNPSHITLHFPHCPFNRDVIFLFTSATDNGGEFHTLGCMGTLSFDLLKVSRLNYTSHLLAAPVFSYTRRLNHLSLSHNFMRRLVSFLLFLSFVATLSRAGQDFYEILGVGKSASKEEIKRAYKTLSLKYHPDKVKDTPKEEAEKRYAAIANAYEILSNDEKRSLYDQGGEEALRNAEQGQGFGGGFNPFDFFGGFQTNFHGQGSHPSHESHHDDSSLPIDATLEEIYTGKKFEVYISPCFLQLFHSR